MTTPSPAAPSLREALSSLLGAIETGREIPHAEIKGFYAALAANPAPSPSITSQPGTDELMALAQAVITARDNFGWSVECDHHIEALRVALARLGVV